MTVAELCSNKFNPAVRSRGLTYFSEGSVSIIAAVPGRVEARVFGTDTYEVSIQWDSDGSEMAVSCTCPYFSPGDPCKHIWATILEMDEIGFGDDFPKRSKLSLTFEDPELGNAGSIDAERLGQDNAVVPLQPRIKDKHPNWTNIFSDVDRFAWQQAQENGNAPKSLGLHQREIWYVLNVAASMGCGHPYIDFYCRSRKRNGELGKIKRLKIDDNEISTVSEQEDREMLGLLLASHSKQDAPREPRYYSYYGHSLSREYVVISPAMYDVVLRKLCQFNRFVWVFDDQLSAHEDGRPISWDDGPPWQLRLTATPNDTRQCWEFTGQLFRGSETIPLTDPVALFAHGVALFPDRIARLDARLEFQWIVCLRRQGKISVPYQDREKLLTRLWNLHSNPDMELPEELQLQPSTIQPTGRLCVKKENANFTFSQLEADISFKYGDEILSANDHTHSFINLKEGTVARRDREQEHELLRQAAELGIRPSNRFGHGPNDVQFPRRLFSPIVETLIKNDWIVEAEGHRIRKPGSYTLSVRSDVDWFELDGQFDFDGASAKLPDLLTALRGGQRFVRLDDGTQGMLPDQWLAQYGALADLGEVEGDKLRFRPSQGALLDALLAAQDDKVQIDRQFKAFQKKLHSFAGVEARKQPSKFAGQLRQYQQEGLGWLHFLRDFRFGGCLADDMGLGKTVQVLALLESRRTRRKPKGQTRAPSLVVVPRSLVFNWIEESERFTPKLKVLNYTGLERKAHREQLDAYDLVVTTYGTLRRDITELKDVRYDYAILDEAQAIKNPQSQSAKACRLINADHRLAMTGTPVENHLGELWSLFEFLNPGMLGRSAAFNMVHKQITPKGSSVNGDSNRGNGSPDPHDSAALKLLAKTLRPFVLRRTKEQVLTELPDKTEQTLYCEMQTKQRKLYDELRDYYRTSLADKVKKKGLNRAKIHVLEALLRLRQAACHPGLLDPAKETEPSAKLEALFEQIDEIVAEGHKALVFSQFTSLLAIVRRQVEQRKIEYEYLDGRTRKRKDRVKRFQEDSSCPLFLISLKAGGHGLNLTAADYVFILDPWWNPAVEAQAVDRAHRIGQTRRVFAYRLICRDTVEEKIIELQKSKRELADAIVSADDSLIRTLTAEELQLLLS